jgi:predicted nuclease with TOPRIM domain
MEGEGRCSHNWEAECRSLRDKCTAMKMELDKLQDEKSKLGIMYEKLLKEKSDMDRKIGNLEGQIEAYKFCMECRR